MQVAPALQPMRILVVDDNPADVFLIKEVMTAEFSEIELAVLRDGGSMMQWIDKLESGQVAVPNVILLDLNMPMASGHEVLQRLREIPASQSVPVVVVTSSDAPNDREAMKRLGATRYFCKPSDYDEFIKLGRVVKEVVS